MTLEEALVFNLSPLESINLSPLESTMYRKHSKIVSDHTLLPLYQDRGSAALSQKMDPS